MVAMPCAVMRVCRMGHAHIISQISSIELLAALIV